MRAPEEAAGMASSAGSRRLRSTEEQGAAGDYLRSRDLGRPW
jgi:hypothetical protein